MTAMSSDFLDDVGAWFNVRHFLPLSKVELQVSESPSLQKRRQHCDRRGDVSFVARAALTNLCEHNVEICSWKRCAPPEQEHHALPFSVREMHWILVIAFSQRVFLVSDLSCEMRLFAAGQHSLERVLKYRGGHNDYQPGGFDSDSQLRPNWDPAKAPESRPQWILGLKCL